jgi:hypothetical protein
MVFVNEIEIWPDRGGTWKGSAPGCPALFFCLFGAIASSSSHIISSFLCGCEWQGLPQKDRVDVKEYTLFYTLSRGRVLFPFSINAKESDLWTPLWSRPGARLVIAPGVVTMRVLGAVLIAAGLSTGREKEEHDHTPRNRWLKKRRLNSLAKPSVMTPDHRAPARGQSALISLHIRVSSFVFSGRSYEFCFVCIRLCFLFSSCRCHEIFSSCRCHEIFVSRASFLFVPSGDTISPDLGKFCYIFEFFEP